MRSDGSDKKAVGESGRRQESRHVQGGVGVERGGGEFDGLERRGREHQA